jgi:hypothetical protein
VAVTLQISNPGALQVDDLYLTQISARATQGSGETSAQALQGCGEVSIDNPGLPFRLGALAPGGHTTMTLHLEVPFCVTDISITEQGKLKNDTGDEWRTFGQSQRVATD